MNNYIVYDLEATCWLGRPPKGLNEIIEIGAVRINAYGELIGTYTSFIKPTVNPLLSGFCKRLTSITQDQVDGARRFDKVINDFLEWGAIHDSETYICSWGSNDRKLLFDDCELHDIESDWLQNTINLKVQYDDLVNNGNGHVKGTLKKIVVNEGFEFTGIAHRAISDAENLAKVFLKYFDEWTFL